MSVVPACQGQTLCGCRMFPLCLTILGVGSWLLEQRLAKLTGPLSWLAATQNSNIGKVRKEGSTFLRWVQLTSANQVILVFIFYIQMSKAIELTGLLHNYSYTYTTTQLWLCLEVGTKELHCELSYPGWRRKNWCHCQESWLRKPG